MPSRGILMRIPSTVGAGVAVALGADESLAVAVAADADGDGDADEIDAGAGTQDVAANESAKNSVASSRGRGISRPYTPGFARPRYALSATASSDGRAGRRCRSTAAGRRATSSAPVLVSVRASSRPVWAPERSATARTATASAPALASP